MAKTPEKLTVRIFYDTWIGEDRLPAAKVIDPKTGKVLEWNVYDLPFDQAVNLMAERKAERADPLPGA